MKFFWTLFPRPKIKALGNHPCSGNQISTLPLTEEGVPHHTHLVFEAKMKKSRFYRDNLKLSRFFQAKDIIGDNFNDNLKLSLARYYRDYFVIIAIRSEVIVAASNSAFITPIFGFFFSFLLGQRGL